MAVSDNLRQEFRTIRRNSQALERRIGCARGVRFQDKVFGRMNAARP